MNRGDQFQTSFLLFKRLYMREKGVGIIGHITKRNCTKLQTIDPEICSILIFIKKDLDILYTIFQEKCLSCYIQLTDQISFQINFQILGNMCIGIACFPGCDVINFEINLIFLIKPFFYISKKLRQKFKYLDNKKIF